MARPESLKECVPGLRQICVRFWPYLRSQRRLIAGSVLALFASVGLRLLEPWPLKLVFDYVLLPSSRQAPFPDMFGQRLGPVGLLTLAAAAFVLITGLRALADYINTVGFALIGNRVLNQVRVEVFRHLQSLSLRFHANARGGDLIVRVISDVNMLRDVASTALLPLLANILVLAGMWVVMFWLQWKLALLALATLPLLSISTGRLGRRIQEVARKQRQRMGAMASTASESVQAIKTVQALSLEDRFARSFQNRSDSSQVEDVKGSRLSASLERTVDFVSALATALVLWYGARQVLARELTPGDLLVFLAYLRKAFNPMQDFAKYTGRLAKATAAGERVLDLLDRTPEVRDLPGAAPAPRFRGEIRFEDVGFAYEPSHWVLRDLAFEVRPGERVALVGPSGIGKSTIASLVLRLYDPAEGRISIDGRDIRDYTIASLRAQISVVLQDSVLFAASIRDNISYAAPHVSSEEIEQAARLANAHEFIESLPQGYDTVVGERGVTLSAGQRQRIAIARAAVRKSPILILDEPTTGLDEENERAVREALYSLSSARTTLLITHDLQLAAASDQVMYIEGGRILERGSPQELLRAGGRYAALYRMQTSLPASSASNDEPPLEALAARTTP